MNPPRSLETLLPVLPCRSVSSQLPARTEAVVRHRLTGLPNILKAQRTEQHAFSNFTGQAHFHKTIWFSTKRIIENKEISGEYTKNQGLFYFFYDLQKRLHFEWKNYSANQTSRSIYQFSAISNVRFTESIYNSWWIEYRKVSLRNNDYMF